MEKFKCTICGYVYDPALGDAQSGVVAGTRFVDLPEAWVCPVCGAAKDRFVREGSAPTRRYSNGDIVVIWDSSKCNHNGNCVRSLPSVFNTAKRPWVNIHGATSGEIVHTVERCPTGALTWEKEDKKHLKTEVPFTKLEGAGNDYLYINCLSYTKEHDWGALSKRMSDRHFGAGSDGIILVVRSDVADFRMRIFNRDGSEGDMCGNGLRCFAKWVYDLGLTKKTEFEVETKAGIMRPRLNLKDGKVESVTADMGAPLFGRAEIPLAELDGPEPVTSLEVESLGQTYTGTAMFLGNPNYVIFVDDVSAVDLEKVGPGLEYHPAFPRRANIEFVFVRSPEEIDMRVWERGSGVTLACGTGACAAVVATILNGKALKGKSVKVNLPGGEVFVEWNQNGRIYQTGPARKVYSGTFFLD